MSQLHFNLTDRGTSPAPRNWQSTWDSLPQPRRWCQHLQGHGRSDLLLHINTHYYTLLRTGGFKLDFIAEGDVGTLDFNRFFLASDGTACLCWQRYCREAQEGIIRAEADSGSISSLLLIFTSFLHHYYIIITYQKFHYYIIITSLLRHYYRNNEFIITY